MDLDHWRKEEWLATKAELKVVKEERLKREQEAILTDLERNQQRLITAACEKGASAWLSALPLKKLGYCLNKQQFRDAICLRYGWKIQGTAVHCACGQENSIDHIMVCKKGGYVAMRHNILRNTEAGFMEKICKDVKIEPQLLPMGNREVDGNMAEGARLDISAQGVWNQQEKTFFDIRVCHPNAASHANKSFAAIYKENETQKKRMYNDRIINVEKASFTPLVFLTTGGMSPECEKLNKRMAEMISLKTREVYSHVVSHIRTRIRFALLKATLVAVRGVRGKADADSGPSEMEEISFNLIPLTPTNRTVVSM